jgi:hypothetical protein
MLVVAVGVQVLLLLAAQVALACRRQSPDLPSLAVVAAVAVLIRVQRWLVALAEVVVAATPLPPAMAAVVQPARPTLVAVAAAMASPPMATLAALAL